MSFPTSAARSMTARSRTRFRCDSKLKSEPVVSLPYMTLEEE